MRQSSKCQAFVVGLIGAFVLVLTLIALPIHPHEEVSSNDTDCSLCAFTRDLYQIELPIVEPLCETGTGFVLLPPEASRILATEVALVPSRAPPAITTPSS